MPARAAQPATVSGAPSVTRALIGAFCAHAAVRRDGAASGTLAGLTFAAKDVFDVEGVTSCFGNPRWLATHEPATRTAPAVSALLDAGATLTGLTLTDELALSLTGENAHYGAPLNVRAPGRVAGGSSAGSAAAVAAELVDFALGTDTGGSVRVPASHCGVLGFRPSHGAVSAEGVWPLAPSFDTVGWFARDATTLARVGDVLLPAGDPAPTAERPSLPRRLIVSNEAPAFLEPGARAAFTAAAAALAGRLSLPLVSVTIDDERAPSFGWLATYLALQNAEACALHEDWIARERPELGSLIAGRFARARAVTRQDVAAAQETRAALVARVATLLADDAWLVWPSAAGAAPLRGLPDAEVDARTGPALTLGALASLAGLPQVSLPVAEVEGCPFGISLIGPRGADRALLAAAELVIASPSQSQRREEPSS